jgi:hypothetical protein
MEPSQVISHVSMDFFNFVFFFKFAGWGENESTWYDGHYVAYSTSPG